MSTIFNIILNFIILNIIYAFDNDDPPKIFEDYPNITCGKKNPKKYTDCTKYGTYSGMLCCWISSNQYETNDAECTILSNKMAKLKGIYKQRSFIMGEGKRFWACGNNTAYLNLKFIYLFLILYYF